MPLQNPIFNINLYFFFDSNFSINPRNILKSKREGYYFMIE